MKYNLQAFTKQFPDNEACLRYILASRFGEAVCPSCKKVGHYHLQKGTSHFVCTCGGHQISPKKGSIFEKSDTDLYKWFLAMYLFATAKNGVSAKELERQLGVTYKCAWRIGQQIRLLMEQNPAIFGGIVEADETYIGGIRRGTRGRGAKGKTPVFGLHQRKGGVYAKAVVDTKAVTLMPIVRKNVSIGTTLMTDEYRSYGKARGMGYKHKTVQHGIKEYVRGTAHTNTIEGFWSQLKRSIDGTHHSVSPKYLQKYLDQHVYLWNRRTSETHVFHDLLTEACA